MQSTKQASIELSLDWQSPHGSHQDRYYFPKVDFWRDVFPGDMGERLRKALPGEPVAEQFKAEEALPIAVDRGRSRIAANQWNAESKFGLGPVPHVGRFYPRGLLSGVPDILPQDRRPFRVLANGGQSYEIDLNHPLSGKLLKVSAKVIKTLNDNVESGQQVQRGGRCTDVMIEMADSGPGIQGALPDVVTDFFSQDPFCRMDEEPDERFYRRPRMVQHLDQCALLQLREFYRRFLQPGMNVLDLMSSWTSHLPEDIGDLQVTGVGMNEQELATNPVLTRYQVHDLNRDSLLALDSNVFDAAVCTVSVEYLTQPFEVFREVARVLKPGAPFVVTFSERWFPPKVIQLWTHLHPFERLAMVMDYFRLSEGFENIQTYSLRGHLRPADDTYAGNHPFADPVFAVWGTRSPH